MPVISFVKGLILLAQLFPTALKAIQAWKDYHGAELDREKRVRLAADIKNVVRASIDSKSTAGLEDAIKNLGKPTAAAPTPKSPS